MRNRKNLLKLVGILMCALTVGVSSLIVKAEINSNLFSLDFSKTTGVWQDLVGTAKLERVNNHLSISNTTQGNNVESVTLLTDAPIQSEGDVELSFLYEGQKNFGIVFRADSVKQSNWQSFAYNGGSEWQLGQPGGKWISGVKGPQLVSGQQYTLLIRYNGTGIEVFLDGESFYKNEHVIFPNDKGEISGDWSGKVGIRLFGDRVTLKMNSLKVGPLNSISNETEITPEVDDKKLEIMRTRWKVNLVGNFERDSELLLDQEVSQYINQLSKQSDDLYTSMNKEMNRNFLWDKKKSDTRSADLTTQFKNLNVLAKSYGTKGTTLYKNAELLSDIKSGLVFLTQDNLYDGKKYYGNWWDWQVGVPQEMINTLFIVYDDFTSEEVKSYSKILDFYLPNAYQQLYGKSQDGSFDLTFIPNFVTTGANRTDLALSALGISILLKDSDKISASVNSVKDVFEIVSKGDGFYEDGSFVQHNNIPYTGSYGNVLIKGVGKIFSIVAETEWEVEKDVLNKFVYTVENAFVPLIIKGEMMPMVNGRSISRAPSPTKEGFGSVTMYNLLIVSEFADPESKQRLQEVSKYWLKQNESFYYKNTRDFKDLMLAKSMKYDTNIKGQDKPFVGSHMYGSMDRGVYSAKDYTLGISMYSNRISAFEAGNKENKKGWHTSDGMVYLYNDDQQFGEAYWPTVDFYRLPGTTADTAPLNDEMSAFISVLSKENHVGGLVSGDNMIATMALNKEGTKNNGQNILMNLQAKKTWFVLNNQIIALGSGINGTSNNGIETIMENRMLDKGNSYELKNKESKIINNQDVLLKSGDWLLLDASEKNKSIGYLALKDTKVQALQETRKGSYKAINDAFPSDKIYSETYQKLIIPHGREAINDTYAYSIVPNATKEQMEAVSSSDEKITILANDTSSQVIQLKDTTAANLLGNNGGKIKGLSINKPSLVLLKEEKEKIKLTISNPRQTNEVITIFLPTMVNSFESDSDKVTLSSDGRTIKLDTAGALGSSFEMSFVKDQPTIEATGLEIKGPSLQVMKKNQTIELVTEVLPENATNQEVKWTVQNNSVVSIIDNQMVSKKSGTTRVTGTTHNGISQIFTVRVTP